MPIEMYSPRTLGRLVERMPKAKTFLRDTFFTDVQTFATEKVDVDIVKGGRELAPFVHPKLGSRPKSNQGFSTKTYRAPLVSESMVTTGEDRSAAVTVKLSYPTVSVVRPDIFPPGTASM